VTANRLDILKNWLTGSTVREVNWDNIKDPLISWADETISNLEAFAKDTLGATYPFDNDGIANQAGPLRDFTTGISNLTWTFSNTVLFTGSVGHVGNIDIMSGYDLRLYSDLGVTLKAYFDSATGNLITVGSTSILSGSDLLLYSDTGITLKASIDGATGNIDTEGTLDVNSTSIFRNNLSLYSGGDLNIYSDAGTTLKFKVDGATGATGIPENVSLYFDGTALTGDTRIVSPSSDVLDIYVGGWNAIKFIEGTSDYGVFNGTGNYWDANGFSAAYGTNSDGSNFNINYTGYNGGVTRFRDFIVYDGKNASCFSIAGSTKAATFVGDVNVDGGLTVDLISAIGTIPTSAYGLHVRNLGTTAMICGESTDADYGVYGSSVGGRGVYGMDATGSGVYGSTVSGSGVYGGTSTGSGVYGSATGSGNGVYGYSSTGNGMYGYSMMTGSGVYGYSMMTGYGVYGYSTSGNGVGGRGANGAYNFKANNASATDYGASSSIRWKSNIVEIDEALNRVLNLRGVFFDWDEEHGGRKHAVGMIAEEVRNQLPEVVVVDPIDDKYCDGMDYGKLTPLLIEAIKELEQRVKKLEK